MGLPAKVELLNDGLHVKLLNEISYIDPSDLAWTAHAGLVSDGASIPKPFWSLAGGPLDGLYREAALIHDQACGDRTRPWKEVHRAFYEAMLDRGVSRGKAKVFYEAVYYLGPRWEILSDSGGGSDLVKATKQKFVSQNIPGIKIAVQQLPNAGPEMYRVIVTQPAPDPIVPKKKLHELATVIEQRESSGRPMTLDEIEYLAPTITSPRSQW